MRTPDSDTRDSLVISMTAKTRPEKAARVSMSTTAPNASMRFRRLARACTER